MVSTHLIRERVLISLACGFLLAAALAFKPVAAQKPAVPAPSGKSEQVLVAVDWVIRGQHAPFFVALDKGFYADQNLEVTISRGYGSGDTVKRVAAKRATFGFADSGALIAARANDEVKVKALAAIYGEPGDAIIYNAKKLGTWKPKSLEGVTITGTAASSTARFFPAFAKINNIDASKVKWAFVEPGSLYALFGAGKVDAVALFVLETPILRNLTKDNREIEVGVMRFADHGMKLYAHALIAEEETIRANPDLVRRFVAATIKGFDYALNNMDEAIPSFGKYHREPGPVEAKDQLQFAKELIYSAEAKAKGIGTFDPGKVSMSIDLVSEGMNLKRKISPDEFYTTDFLPKR